MLNKILSYADYKFLRVLAAHCVTSDSASLKAYDSIDFKDAPEDTLLIFVSNNQVEPNIFEINSEEVVALSGSVVIKISKQSAIKAGLEQNSGLGLVYFDTLHFKSNGDFDTLDRQVGSFKELECSSKVSLVSSDSVRKMLDELDERYLTGTFDVAHYVRNALNYKKVVNA